MRKTNHKIDFVIAWVDGNDPKWQKDKQKYSPAQGQDARNNRYRDWDNLRYWFRGVENFAPWINNIFFVTYGHLPPWLNLEHPKLKIVKHEDYIPQEYLPTFSSHPIELNFHRIPELSQHFVYFNDDMFLTKKTLETDFFRDGLPCDTAVLNALCFDRMNSNDEGFDNLFMIPAYNMVIINSHFNKKSSIQSNLSKWLNIKYGTDLLRTLCLIPWRHFPGFVNYHFPYSYNKETLDEVWDKEFVVLNKVCKNKFRASNDVNTWLFSYWQLAKGEFFPRNPNIGGKFAIFSDEKLNQDMYYAITSQKYKFICMNDCVEDDLSFGIIKNKINDCFEQILPQKSSFELEI